MFVYAITPLFETEKVLGSYSDRIDTSDLEQLNKLSKYLQCEIKDFPKATNEPYNNFKSFENNILENKSISKETIKFYETSNFSNIIGQMFEIGDNSIGKLAIIDYGEFASDNKVKRHVYLLGEIINDAGEIKFCRTFTLVFSNES